VLGILTWIGGYVTRIILRPLSALFGSQFILPMETSVTFIGACANEIIDPLLMFHLLNVRIKRNILKQWRIIFKTICSKTKLSATQSHVMNDNCIKDKYKVCYV
jgi:hypothetical protein